MVKSKEPIRLRRRVLKTGNTSLYLDIYMDGKRSYEYLNLYLVPEKTRADRERNRETLRMADAVRARRVVDFQNGRFGFENSVRLKGSFLDYFRKQCERRRENAGSSASWRCWQSTLRHLELYCRPGITFKDVTPAFVKGFREYLEKKATFVRKNGKKGAKGSERRLSRSSMSLYFSKFRTCIKRAYEDGILPRNPFLGIEGFRKEEKECVYLTLEEVRAMAARECDMPGLRNAFLFSCLTGLRKSDIEKMTWSEVRRQGKFTRIVFRQKKTGGQEYIDISPEAEVFMGKRGAPDDLVFADFSYSSFMMMKLRNWALSAGVDKDITFHSARHTFAVMMLMLGTDLYTVQKLLGHKSISTTLMYAHIVDKKKQEAAMLIPSILPAGEGGGEKDDGKGEKK